MLQKQTEKTGEMGKNDVLIGTSNPGKFFEIMEIFDGMPFKFLRPADFGITANAPEAGETYEENAYSKAKFYFDKGGILTVAEDSGIVVDALKDELGVKTRRWGAGEYANDEEWITYFLNALKDVPEQKRTARFICVAALILPDGKVDYFKGEARGIITRELEAPIMKGLPLSSCFRPEGFDKVYAALDPSEKNAVSHRGKALRQVKDFLLGRIE
jgi:XTP/dITP diphosphohydrolase